MLYDRGDCADWFYVMFYVAYLGLYHWNLALLYATTLLNLLTYLLTPPVLWRCWLSSRKGIRPVKTERWSADVVICLERGADLHVAQVMPLPLTVSCFSKIHIGFTFLVPAHPGSRGQRAVKRVCVCVCVTYLLSSTYLPRRSNKEIKHKCTQYNLQQSGRLQQGTKFTNNCPV